MRCPLLPRSYNLSDKKRIHDSCLIGNSALAGAHALAVAITLWNGDSH